MFFDLLGEFVIRSVGMTGFEPATPSSRTKYATGLRYLSLYRKSKSTKLFVIPFR